MLLLFKYLRIGLISGMLLETNSSVYDKDIRDAKLFNHDIAALNNELISLNESMEPCVVNWDAIFKEFSHANEFNTSLENDKYQFRLAEDYFSGKTEGPILLL